jgi:hypothetical protein
MCCSELISSLFHIKQAFVFKPGSIILFEILPLCFIIKQNKLGNTSLHDSSVAFVSFCLIISETETITENVCRT